jgi:hypothetical protein
LVLRIVFELKDIDDLDTEKLHRFEQGGVSFLQFFIVLKEAIDVEATNLHLVHDLEHLAQLRVVYYLLCENELVLPQAKDAGVEPKYFEKVLTIFEFWQRIFPLNVLSLFI